MTYSTQCFMIFCQSTTLFYSSFSELEHNRKITICSLLIYNRKATTENRTDTGTRDSPKVVDMDMDMDMGATIKAIKRVITLESNS